MITLDPALHELRNKELSFGCLLNVTFNDNEDAENPRLLGEHLCLIIGNNRFVLKRDLQHFDELYGIRPFSSDDDGIKIIGHPLTRGRICCIFSEKLGDAPSTADIMDQITDILEESPVLFDQNELQRMTSPKRPELRELLIKFAEYI